MKDFYDIYYLSGIFDFEGSLLREAVLRTLEHRKRELSADVFSEIAAFKSNRFLITQWRAFEPAKETGLPFEDAIDRLCLFLEPIYQNIYWGASFNKHWRCDTKQWY